MLKKNSFSQKNQDSLAENQNNQTSDLGNQKTATFLSHKNLDKKLVQKLNKKKLPSLKQLKQTLRILSPKEKLIISISLIIIVISLIFVGNHYYFKNFLPVPAIGGQYVEGLLGSPQYINPLLAFGDADYDITRLVYSGLLKYDKDLQLVPDLAAYYHASEDGTIYTFTLKQNLKWHDGESLTADDIIFTIQNIKDPDFKSSLLISFRGVEVEKIDDLTVKFILPEPYPAFLEVLTFGIIPEHIWGETPAANANLTEYNLKPIGSGAWKFEKLTKDNLGNIKTYTLVRNSYYHGPRPYLEKIIFKFYPNFETGVTALKNHSIEGLSVLPKYLKPELSKKKDINYHSFYLPQYTAIFFNQKQNEILKDKNIRKALALGINKSKILTEALNLEGEIIDGPILPTETTVDQEKKLDFDLETANEILTDAGWEEYNFEQYQAWLNKSEEEANDTSNAEQNENNESTSDSQNNATGTEEIKNKPALEVAPEDNQPFYRIKDDKLLEINITTVDESENKIAAQLIKEAWQNIGVKVDLQIVTPGRIGRDVIKPRNYEVLLFGIIVGSNPDPYPFWHSSQIQDPGLNLALLANREVDKLLEESKKSSDPEILQKNYQRFQDILLSEIPAVFLYHPTYTYVVDKKIKGLNIQDIIVPADRFNNIEDWYIKTKRTWQGSIDNPL